MQLHNVLHNAPEARSGATEVVGESKEEGGEYEVDHDVVHLVLHLVRLSKRHPSVVGALCRDHDGPDVN